MNKIVNYYRMSVNEIKKIKKLGQKPRLLLHACCGPCSTFPLEFLVEHFDVTIMFNNSNIYPREEYERRKNELIKFLEYFYRDYNIKVAVHITNYDNEAYNSDLEPYKDLKEGKERCFLCYEKRMKEAGIFAKENGFDYFTTVMTISRQKNSQIINSIGHKIEEELGEIKYFYSDFKKKAGIDRARELRLKYELYQQLYCGCKFSYNAQKTTKN